MRFHRENEKERVILDIYKGEETPYYYAADGVLETYVRVGNESVKATPDEQKRMEKFCQSHYFIIRYKTNTLFNAQHSQIVELIPGKLFGKTLY